MSYFVSNRSIPPFHGKFLRPVWFLKKTAFLAGIVALVLSFVTCNFGQPASASDLPVEYTDVVYSADGTQVTLYLDGVGVPLTQQQRALTTDLAKMACDYFEVVFYNYNPHVVARATWEIGQLAGISGIYKGADPDNTGHHYFNPLSVGDFPTFTNGSRGVANLLVGRKADKVLLAAGQISRVNDIEDAPWLMPIRSDTKSITFTVHAFRTNLDLVTNDDSETSFITASGSPPNYDYPAISAINTKGNNNEWAQYIYVGGVKYPYYKLPDSTLGNFNKVATKYNFRSEYNFGSEYILVRNDGPGGPIKPEIIKQVPRFFANGRYYDVKAGKIDMGTKIYFYDVFEYFFEDGHSGFQFLHDGIFIGFDTRTSQGGIFSFTFRIPVYNLTRDISTNGGVPFTTWYVQPGLGTDLFLLDNGVENEGTGGSILMGYNMDFGLDIITNGMP